MFKKNNNNFITKYCIIIIFFIVSFLLQNSLLTFANEIIGKHNFNDITSLTKKVIPSVVPIRTTKIIENSLNRYENKYIYYKETSIENSIGSGFIISNDGYILTNTHIIDNSDKIFITYNGKEYEAEFIGSDEISDIAIIKIKDQIENLPYLKLKDNIQLDVGENVIVLGNPYGLGISVSYGIISALNRNIKNTEYNDLIQTDAAINKGNSGGPMFNLNGDVIGITSIIFSESGISNGVGFAIPIKNIIDIIEKLKIYGYIQRGWLGIKTININMNIRKALNFTGSNGVLVTDIFNNGPAEKAGIIYNDIITSFDDKTVDSTVELTKIIRNSTVGSNVYVSILRNGKQIKKKVKIEELPTSIDLELDNIKINSMDIFDMYLTEINNKIIDKFELYSKLNGLLVLDVKKNGKADNNKIEIGDIILTANQQQLKSKNDLLNCIKQNKIQEKKTILLLVRKMKTKKNILINIDL